MLLHRNKIVHCIEVLCYWHSPDRGGDGEGASQASVSRIVKQVSEVLSDHMEDVVVFNVDPNVLDCVARGFFGFNGSEYKSFGGVQVVKRISFSHI